MGRRAGAEGSGAQAERSAMQVQWYGQSAFRLSAQGTTVAIDPFADLARLEARGIRFDYPPIEGLAANLLLVTHEHADHNGVQAVHGEPEVLRSTAGRLSSRAGEVLAVASEHDPAAGTERGPNTIFVLSLGGTRVCHFGDFGQRELREEQAAAIGAVDLLLLPVGGGPTIGARQAAEITRRISPRWVVPMHYRTPRVNFLEPPEEFLALVGGVERVRGPSFETDELPRLEGPLAVVPAAP
jgi:L-ascorbate metabolism protein UlaG (beta-lactamase superfamily)